MRETDLSQPVKNYLVSRGYRVQAEVKDCDIAARNDDELVIVELKTSANMTLLIQATARQKITPVVYVAIPEPSSQKGAHWRGTLTVLSRLNLGLLLVNFNPPGITVKEALTPHRANIDDEISEPNATRSRTSGRVSALKRKAILTELDGRSLDLNEAGSHRRQLVTAYRENAILIGCCLKTNGPSSCAELKAMGTGKKTTDVLSRNYYGWFERIRRGTYQLTEKGRLCLNEYPDLLALSEQYINKYNVKLKQNRHSD